MMAPDEADDEAAAFRALRKTLTAIAEKALSQSPTATGVTVFLPRPDGTLDEVHLPKRRTPTGPAS
jgi:hypothetical protein